MIINGFWYTYIISPHYTRGIFFHLFLFLFSYLKLGCVKIVNFNYFSHDLSIGRRKSFKCRILMEVQIVSRVAHAIIYENAPRATHRRKRSNGSDRWAMSLWSVKRQIRLLSQVSLERTFFVLKQGMDTNFLMKIFFVKIHEFFLLVFKLNFFCTFLKQYFKQLQPLGNFSILPFIRA